MKRLWNNKKIKLCFLLFCSIFILNGCVIEKQVPPAKEEKTPFQEFFLNSVLEVDIREDRNDHEEILKEIQSRIQNIEQKMSLKLEDSEVVKINDNAGIHPVNVSDDTFYVIEKSLKYSELSSGAFDVSVGNLVQLWGIGTENEKIPSENEIKTALSTVNYKNVVMDSEQKTIFLQQKGMSIDLGAIAKGYAADAINEILKKYQVNSAIINLAGNIYIHGDKNGEPFKVGIQNPYEHRGDFLGIYEAANQSIVTSGIYERYFEKEGKRYHHILSTNTGYPVENELVAVSIISTNSIDGDALSTSVFALGLEQGMPLVESLDDVEAIFITHDKKIYLSDGAKTKFKLVNDTFEIVTR